MLTVHRQIKSQSLLTIQADSQQNVITAFHLTSEEARDLFLMS